MFFLFIKFIKKTLKKFISFIYKKIELKINKQIKTFTFFRTFSRGKVQ